MLVLTRKSDERILVGNSIELVVLSVQGNQVRLGIRASAEISITRMSAAPDLMPLEIPAGSDAQQLCPAT